MEDVQEVKRLVKELQNTSSPKDTLEILKLLKSTVKASEKLLRETRCGLAVGRLRENSNKEVANLARDLVNKWKSEVKADKGSGGATTPAAASPGQSATNGTAASPKNQAASPLSPTVATSAAPPPPLRGTAAAIAALSPKTPVYDGPLRTFKTDGVTFSTTGDRTRDKCIEMVYDALASDSGSPAELIKSRAVTIEKTVLAGHDGNSTGPYRAKMRSLYLNLKDKGNPELRHSVVSGDLAIPRLCKMAPADMASQQRKAADNLLREEMLFKSLGASEPEAETDAFQCARCKERKTRYRQAQTRSADEPMTTFVTCVNCGNRWKFS